MSYLTERLKNFEYPWFLRKKFIKILSIVVLVLLPVGIYFTYDLYTSESLNKYGVQWNEVMAPMVLPAIPVMIWVSIILLWMIMKLKEMQRNALTGIPQLLQPQEVTFNAGETELFKLSSSTRHSAGTLPKFGAFRITSNRIMHTQTISAKRVGVLIGMDEPDVTFSIAHQEVRQCGFGLDEKHFKNFCVITKTGEQHSFGGVTPEMVDAIITKLGWRRTRIDEQIYWIR